MRGHLNVKLDWRSGLAFLCSRRLPEEGILFPNHVGILYLS